jgi:sorbitol/mannitol transport system permease protein
MAFVADRRTKDILMWMLSTKMMPAVGVLIPIYLIFRDFGLLDTAHGLTPRADADQPADHRLDALHLLPRDPRRDPRGRAHGRRRTLWGEIVYVLTPMAVPGIASTMLLNIILAWNEAFWTINADHGQRRAADRLHRVVLQPAGAVLGEAVGRLDLAIAPILILGWFSQKQLVRGLTFGAVK